MKITIEPDNDNLAQPHATVTVGLPGDDLNATQLAQLMYQAGLAAGYPPVALAERFTQVGLDNQPTDAK